MTWTRLIFLFTIASNIFLIASINLTEPGSLAGILASVILVLLALPMVLYAFRNVVHTLAWNACLVSITLIILDGLFFFKLIAITNLFTWTYVYPSDFNNIQFLEKSPYVKFAPNSLIRSQGARGSDFTYEWETDKLGFKNLKGLANKKNISYIALGNSFTEGMGVSVENTWPSQVNKDGLNIIYNAGVQGYAASQFLGTYKLLKDKLPHDGIIIGALGIIHEREKTYMSTALEVKKRGTGGIGSIVRGGRVGGNKNSILVALIRKIKNIIIKLPENVEIPIHEIPIPSQNQLENKSTWIRYVQALSNLSQIALNEGKRVILLQFPFRHEIYFDLKAQGLNDINSTRYYIELSTLKKSLPKNVEIIDIFQFLKTASLENNKNLYFNIDGHLNEFGNQKIAKFISLYLKHKDKKLLFAD